MIQNIVYHLVDKIFGIFTTLSRYAVDTVDCLICVTQCVRQSEEIYWFRVKESTQTFYFSRFFQMIKCTVCPSGQRAHLDQVHTYMDLLHVPTLMELFSMSFNYRTILATWFYMHTFIPVLIFISLRACSFEIVSMIISAIFYLKQGKSLHRQLN